MILNYLRKFEKLVYFNRCWIHRNDSAFRKMVMEGYQNPDYLWLQRYGKEYDGNIIYFIREQGRGMGFFAEIGVVLIKLYYAYERGFVPYVRWGENFLYYEKENVNGKDNAFEYYFEPVSSVTDITNAAHVLLANDSHYKYIKDKFAAVSYDVSEEYIDAMAMMMRAYIRYNSDMLSYLKKECETLLEGKRTIGVHYRGTDFRRQFNNHPVAVEINQEIDRLRELLKKGIYEQIFVASDEEEAINRFRECFGDLVKSYEDVFRESARGDVSIAFSTSERKNHHYLLGREVLRDEYTLVQCDALVCGYSNITFIARIMKKAWENQYYDDYVLIDNGINHNNNYFWKSVRTSGMKGRL